jgi:hypothetical protein
MDTHGIDSGPIEAAAYRLLNDYLHKHGIYIPEATLRPIVDVIVRRISAPYVHNGNPSLTCRIVDIVDSPNGKWPYALGTVVVIDMEKMFDRFRHSVMQQITHMSDKIASSKVPHPFRERLQHAFEHLNDTWKQFRIDDYASSSTIQMNDRASIYSLDKIDLDQSIAVLTDQVALAIGLAFPATFLTPIATALVCNPPIVNIELDSNILQRVKPLS